MENLITKAIRTDDIDAALALLQDALGIDDGGLAGQLFDENKVAAWPTLTHYERSRQIAEYLKTEVIFACPSIDEEVTA